MSNTLSESAASVCGDKQMSVVGIRRKSEQWNTEVVRVKRRVSPRDICTTKVHNGLVAKRSHITQASIDNLMQ